VPNYILRPWEVTKQAFWYVLFYRCDITETQQRLGVTRRVSDTHLTPVLNCLSRPMHASVWKRYVTILRIIKCIYFLQPQFFNDPQWIEYVTSLCDMLLNMIHRKAWFGVKFCFWQANWNSFNQISLSVAFPITNEPLLYTAELLQASGCKPFGTADRNLVICCSLTKVILIADPSGRAV
jgi:hypothetical protein